MKISDFLCAKAVSADLKGTTKQEIIDEMVKLLGGNLPERRILVNDGGVIDQQIRRAPGGQ